MSHYGKPGEPASYVELEKSDEHLKRRVIATGGFEDALFCGSLMFPHRMRGQLTRRDRPGPFYGYG